MAEWPAPKNLKQLRGFLGITRYYRRFIRHYGVVSKPLTELLKKGAFKWGPEAAVAFQELKTAMTTAHVLSLPDYTLPFTIKADACGNGVGAVLMQQGKPLAYFSKGLSQKNQGLSTYEKELLAIVMATQKWYTYLQGNHFLIKTDHQSLKYLLEQRLSTLFQQKWLAKLMGLDYETVYKKGKDNVAADSLSRLCESQDDGEIKEITTLQSGWLTDITNSYTADSAVQKIVAGIAVASPQYKDFTYSQGLVKYQGKIYVGNSGVTRASILWELHDSSVGGHSGQDATYKRVSQFFYWPLMKQDIITYVQSNNCQRIKSGNTFPGGLLQPLPIPSQIWEDISMDFIDGLPKAGDKDCILVVIDRFTKVGHFIVLAHPYTATTVAQLFLDNICKLHGLPNTIVSDRDKVFTSQFWKALFSSVGTNTHMSTSYHPQTDGQTERLNRCLEQYLRAMTSARLRQWHKWFALAEWWYNSTHNSAIKMSPFEALYGVKPRQLCISAAVKSNIDSVLDFQVNREAMNQVLKEAIQVAQNRYKQYADQKRSDKQYMVGDYVFLKLQPYRQLSVAVRKYLKLSHKYFGPYQILEKVGPVAYRL